MARVSVLGDRSKVPADTHGCPKCPHTCIGPSVKASPDVFVNGKPVLRVGDLGVHTTCCGSNVWVAVEGSSTVFVNGLPVHRKGDKDLHCGGMGEMVDGSADVNIGGLASGASASEIAAWLGFLLSVALELFSHGGGQSGDEDDDEGCTFPPWATPEQIEDYLKASYNPDKPARNVPVTEWCDMDGSDESGPEEHEFAPPNPDLPRPQHPIPVPRPIPIPRPVPVPVPYGISGTHEPDNTEET